ncbi:MAG: class I SAM-dependent methyltransferase [Vicinamibacterales bacterium]
MAAPGTDPVDAVPEPSPLEALMAADGTLEGSAEAEWRDFVEHVVETLDVGPGTSVWDAGCGAGAFLYPLWENGYVVGGMDQAASLVERARAAMPQGVFIDAAPTSLDPAEPWDVVVASRGFSSLADVDAVRGVLARMAAKATHAIAALGVVEEGTPGGSRLLMSRRDVLRLLAEIGVTGVQFEEAAGGRFNVFARV